MIVVSVPLIALMGMTSVNLVLQHDESHERTASLNARNLVVAADQVLADAVNAETGARGYGVTRSSSPLQPGADPDQRGTRVVAGNSR